MDRYNENAKYLNKNLYYIYFTIFGNLINLVLSPFKINTLLCFYFTLITITTTTYFN